MEKIRGKEQREEDTKARQTKDVNNTRENMRNTTRDKHRKSNWKNNLKHRK